MIVSRTPFRISLVGGGSDIADYYRTNPGAVVAMSVSLYMYVTVNRRFDDTIRVSYTRLEIVDRLDDLQHDLIREALRVVGIERGVEVTTIADVPGGTGLGSSSSLTVGLLNALYAFRGVRMSPDALARQACAIEIETLGRPIGKQDQYMAAYGGLRRLSFLPDGSVHRTTLPLTSARRRALAAGLLLFYTGIERDGNRILAGVKHAIATDVAKRATLDKMVAVTHDLTARLRRGDLSTIGDALNQSWLMKRRMGPAVSNPWLDEVHGAALAAGAQGAKILGAGGGGFLLAACEPARQAAVTRAMTDRGLRRIRFGLESTGSRILLRDAHDPLGR